MLQDLNSAADLRSFGFWLWGPLEHLAPWIREEPHTPDARFVRRVFLPLGQQAQRVRRRPGLLGRLLGETERFR